MSADVGALMNRIQELMGIVNRQNTDNLNLQNQINQLKQRVDGQSTTIGTLRKKIDDAKKDIGDARVRATSSVNIAKQAMDIANRAIEIAGKVQAGDLVLPIADQNALTFIRNNQNALTNAINFNATRDVVIKGIVNKAYVQGLGAIFNDPAGQGIIKGIINANYINGLLDTTSLKGMIDAEFLAGIVKPGMANLPDALAGVVHGHSIFNNLKDRAAGNENGVLSLKNRFNALNIGNTAIGQNLIAVTGQLGNIKDKMATIRGYVNDVHTHLRGVMNVTVPGEADLKLRPQRVRGWITGVREQFEKVRIDFDNIRKELTSMDADFAGMGNNILGAGNTIGLPL